MQEIIARLLACAGLDPASPELDLVGTEPVLTSSFRVGAAAQASIAASGVAAARLWQARGGGAQRVRVDMRNAAAEFLSERHLKVDGAAPGDIWDPIAGLYPTRDGYVRLHTNFPHHRDGILALLRCENHRDAVAAALLRRSAEAFEAEATQAGMCVAAYRSFAAWDAHPQAPFVAARPPVIVTQVGAAPAERLPRHGAQPLSGIRVLDLTRVIAGPVGARVLAFHGAEVLHVTSPRLPNIGPLVRDTGRGKRPAFLDLREKEDRDTLRDLIADADVLVQSYRQGALAALGFDAGAMTALRPGLVMATLNAYGDTGPWAGKRGFDSLVQTATGFNHAEGGGVPKVLPCQALDHASGYFLALGVMAALQRRTTSGGSWQVSVSLASTGQWLRGLGRIDGQAPPLEVADLLETDATGMTAVRHAAELSETPVLRALPSYPLGHFAAAWS
jgi:crotonobetainyl-CoA:carnitine CoA-transferase CaiB-like acyl-CoA transferase